MKHTILHNPLDRAFWDMAEAQKIMQCLLPQPSRRTGLPG